MIGERFEEKKCSSGGMYMRSIADITKLGEIAFNCKRGGSKSSCRINM